MAQPNNKADPLEEAFSSFLRAIGGIFADAFIGLCQHIFCLRYSAGKQVIHNRYTCNFFELMG